MRPRRLGRALRRRLSEGSRRSRRSAMRPESSTSKVHGSRRGSDLRRGGADVARRINRPDHVVHGRPLRHGMHRRTPAGRGKARPACRGRRSSPTGRRDSRLGRSCAVRPAQRDDPRAGRRAAEAEGAAGAVRSEKRNGSFCRTGTTPTSRFSESGKSLLPGSWSWRQMVVAAALASCSAVHWSVVSPPPDEASFSLAAARLRSSSRITSCATARVACARVRAST